jgi:subtilase family serine protease
MLHGKLHRVGLATLFAAFLAVPAVQTAPAFAAPLAAVPTFGGLPPGARILGPARASTPVSLTFILRSTAPTPGRELTAYRHRPSAAWVRARYAPPAATYRALERYLESRGLHVSHTYASRLALDVTGTLGSAATALHTQVVAVRAPGNAVHFTAITPARLPDRLAAHTAAVFGLTDRSPVIAAPITRIAGNGRPVPSSSDTAGPVPTSVDTLGTQALASFTVTGPTTVPTGQEVTLDVTLKDASGKPLAGYVITPLVPQGVHAEYGNNVPNSLTTNAQGQASFWLLDPNPGTVTVQVTAAAPNAAAGAPPAYLTQNGLPLSVVGPVIFFHNLTPQQINTAYDATPLLAAGDNGHGVSIGISIWNAFSMQDIASFFQEEGIPEPSVTVVPVDGTPIQGDGGIEATLDVERAGSTAPGANIIVYDGNSGTNESFLDALVTAINDDKVNILSMSWGIAEDYIGDQSFAPLESLFDYASAEGMTVFVSSGDEGSRADPQVASPDVNWPADGPAVVAVGGTELAINAATGQIASEQAWSPDGTFGSGSSAGPAASTGGFSRYFPRPSWQIAPGLPDVSVNPFRGVPDVSLLATLPGYQTFVQGQMQGYGGTSASTPTWAGFLADIESGLGGISFGGSFDALLYAIYDSPAGPGAFHAITVGTNGDYSAGPGWNPVTGLGTPDVANLNTQVGSALNPAQLVMSSGYLTATAGSKVSVAAEVLDSIGLSLAGSSVTATTASPGAAVSPESATTDATGTASFTLTGSTAGRDVYTFSTPGATASAPPITATVTVDWTAPPAKSAGRRAAGA